MREPTVAFTAITLVLNGSPARRALFIAVLAALSGLLSNYGNDAFGDLTVLGVPPLPAIYFGIVLAIACRMWTGAGQLATLAIFGATFLAWFAAFRAADQVQSWLADVASLSGYRLFLAGLAGGFVGSDTAASFLTPVVVTTTADNLSPVGTYPITASGGSSPNYTLTFVAGTLTVTFDDGLSPAVKNGSPWVWSQCRCPNRMVPRKGSPSSSGGTLVMPVPASRISRGAVPLALTATEEVWPPYRSNSEPEAGDDPRTPQRVNRTGAV